MLPIYSNCSLAIDRWVHRVLPPKLVHGFHEYQGSNDSRRAAVWEKAGKWSWGVCCKRCETKPNCWPCISRPCSVFIRNGGVIKCTATGSQRYCRREDMEQGGMEVLCTFYSFISYFCFIGDKHWTNKLSTLFQSKRYNASSNDGYPVVKLKPLIIIGDQSDKCKIHCNMAKV